MVAVAHVAALVFLRIAPGRRQLVEASAAGLVLPAALPVGPEIYAALSALAAALTYHLVYGPPSQRSGLRITATASRVARAGLPADAVWLRLVPGSGHPDDFWTGTLLDFAADPDDAMTLYGRFASADGLFTEATFTFLAAEPPREARYQVEFDGLPENEEMTLRLRLTEEDRFSTLIESEAVRGNMTPARAVLLWFDDTMGDDWTGIAGLGSRRRHWRIERPAPAAADLPAAETPAPADAPAPAALRTQPTHTPPRPKILNARLKDLPDPDDFEEPFDIMRLMEEVRASRSGAIKAEQIKAERCRPPRARPGTPPGTRRAGRP